jgi:hypothetical protein
MDSNVQEGTYVDFEHGLGYPPMFLAWYNDGVSSREIPYMEKVGFEVTTGYPSYEVNGFCDSTRIRIYFWRRSELNPVTWSVKHHYAQTISIKVLPFAENLAGLDYGE